MYETQENSRRLCGARMDAPGRRVTRRATMIALAALILALSVLSCAYFNTLYNARRLYSEAEEQRVKQGTDRSVKGKYDDVVKKCANLISSYPDSRWVDDALFLMGKALVRQGEYSKGVRKFTELRTNFPESKYVAPSLYWLALANYEKRDYLQALEFTDRFLKRHPDHELRNQIMFLAGDVNLELENAEEALNFYSLVAERAENREVVDEAVMKSATLFYKNEQWEEAAANYEKALRKGLPWERRYELSLSLGECYTKIGKCADAMKIFDQLNEEIVTSKEKPPVIMGRASSYVCMDSLDAALATFRGVTKDFPKSSFSAEAFYRMGIIYHEEMDSLVRAQNAFSKVAGEYANSPFAAVSLQKSNSIKRLSELRQGGGEAESREQLADKRFLTAEIQLMRLGEIDLAIENYRAVVDSFTDTDAAPKAAYALAWIYRHERVDSLMAVETYREIVTRFPRTPQAKGAVIELRDIGGDELGNVLAAYIDSALADTAAARVEEEARRRRMQADSAAVDSMIVRDGAAADSTGVPDASTVRGVIPMPDSSAARWEASPRDLPGGNRSARRDSLLIPLGGTARDTTAAPPDTTAAPDASAAPDTSAAQPGDAERDTTAAPPDTTAAPDGSTVPDDSTSTSGGHDENDGSRRNAKETDQT